MGHHTVTPSAIKTLRERTGCGLMDCKRALEEAKGEVDAAIDVLRKLGRLKASKKSDRVAAEGKIVIQVSEDKRCAVMLEVNCETDFVARDEHFQSFCQQVAERALSERVETVEALKALAYTPSNRKTVEDMRQQCVGQIGENIHIRRLFFMASKHQVVYYLHRERIGVILDFQGEDSTVAREVAMHITAQDPMCIDVEGMPADLLSKEEALIKERFQKTAADKPAEVLDRMVQGALKKFCNERSLLNQSFVKDPSITVGQLLKSCQGKVISFERFELGQGVEKVCEDFAESVKQQIEASNRSES